MGPHVREGVKPDIHIKPKSYELEPLGGLVVQQPPVMTPHLARVLNVP